MSKYLLPFIFILTICCTSKKNLETKVDSTPTWIKEFPISSNYYIGIGVSDINANPIEYIKIAQKNALHNLISQIKVNISSQSILLEMEREYEFKQDFKSNLEMKSDDIIEGYELVSTYTRDNEYWVYYRLNKNTYRETRANNIKKASDESKIYLKKALDNNTNPKDKYTYYVQALNVLEPYLNESILTDFNNEKVNLMIEILSNFRTYINSFQIDNLNRDNKVTLGGSINNIPISVEYNKNRIANIPLIATSKTLELLNITEKTNQNGVFETSIKNIKNIEPIQKIEVNIDFQKWLNETTSSDFIKKIFENIKGHQLDIPIYINTPKIYIQTNEKHFGINKGKDNLKFAAESKLHSFGLNTVTNKKDAQLIMTISSNTEKGNIINGQKMFTSMLKMNVQVKDVNNKVIFSSTINDIKGLQLSFDKADQNAYQKASKELNDKIIPNFINNLIGL